MLLKEMFDLSGKVILVTGGSGYLGKIMCEALAEFGATLVISSRSFGKTEEVAKDLFEKFGNQNHPLELDTSDFGNIKKNIDYIVQRFGKIDVLINNAYYGAGKELLSMDDNEWNKGIDGSINSVYRCTKAVLPYMLENNYGKIINIASMYGMVSPDVSIYEGNNYYNPANYGAGKAAVIQFTRYIAGVYGKFGITSNSVSPGPFPNLDVQKNKKFIEMLENKVPLKRIGSPDDLKGVIVLLSSNASNYINGENIVVDGGWTIW
ncbi:SDR family oxidoreductase [Methanosarcina sp. WWM596]|uniref:SDR family oxidoreductase n=1 Tax=Methanosarcina sp. WWM596 TaxID=1434103 RepID=UPI000615A75D|nr:SDR family oxidoreductase [Methanosarcina sp. WWM596]AKB18834.1 Gluconate 5-dehydrogenase [Methanosarcina sp. WWM596]